MSPEAWCRSLRIILLFVALPCSTFAQDRSEKFKDWLLLCQSQAQCVISQSVVQGSERTPVAQVRILAKPSAIAVSSFPLGTPLKGGWRQSVDGGPATQRGFDYCDKRGCHSIVQMKKTMIGAFRRGRWLEVTFLDSKRQPVSVRLSLLGFTGSFASMTGG